MASKKSEVKLLDRTSPVTALALALAVYQNQGFVRSGDGFYSRDEQGNSVYTADNKTVLAKMLADGVQPDTTNLETAQGIIDNINGKLMLKKLTTSLSSFETAMVGSLSGVTVGSMYNLAVIASMPQMANTDQRRQMVESRLESVQFTSQHVGKIKQRHDLMVEVIDVKYIQSTGVFMITTLHDEQNVVKFWWRDQPDLADVLKPGAKVNIRGTVIRHDVDRQNRMAETMINRVKVVTW
jgi:hypothetical protein